MYLKGLQVGKPDTVKPLQNPSRNPILVLEDLTLFLCQIGADVATGETPAASAATRQAGSSDGPASISASVVKNERRRSEAERDVRWFDRTLKMIQMEEDEFVPSSSSAETGNNPPEDEFSSADLALASAPGIYFDPRTRCFSPEELKPQPIIRKRSKVRPVRIAKKISQNYRPALIIVFLSNSL